MRGVSLIRCSSAVGALLILASVATSVFRFRSRSCCDTIVSWPNTEVICYERRRVSIQHNPPSFPAIATCLPPPPPTPIKDTNTNLGSLLWGGGCYCHWGQRRRGSAYSVLHDGPRVPDVTCFNDIIMTVL